MENKDTGKNIINVDDCPYLFIDEPFYENFIKVIEKSKPNEGKSLDIIDIKPDFDFGEFKIFLKTSKTKNIEIKFIKNNVNEFWSFLEFAAIADNPLFFKLFYSGYETFLYTMPYDKRNLRFIIMNTFEHEEKAKKKKIFKHTYEDTTVILDIIINKKRFISLFYEKLFEMFKKESAIAFFEPPLTDFDFWVKDSKILKEFLEK